MIEKRKSEVSLLIEIRFLVKPSTSKTSFKVREGVREGTNVINEKRGTITDNNTILTSVRISLVQLSSIINHMCSGSNIHIPIKGLIIIKAT